jgi:serine/threonine protein phosphatase PrpC
MSGRMLAFGATHPGRRRENNEDAWSLEAAHNAAILADGMGGENCGEVCSAIAVEMVAKYLKAPEAGLSMEDLAKEAIRAANRRALEVARERRECKGMGSTIVLAIWELPRILVANVGDSRGYVFRNGALRQVTYDQNFANELRTNLGLSEERVLSMPNRNVLTMAVGTNEQVLIRTHTENLLPGDRLLMCSDGLYGPVSDGTLALILSEPGSLQEKVERLIACANEHGGPDNITAVLLEYQGEEK